MSEQSILHRIFQAIGHVRRLGHTPQYVLLGMDEYDDLRNRTPHSDHRIEKDKETVFGVELLRVNRASFLEVTAQPQ